MHVHRKGIASMCLRPNSGTHTLLLISDLIPSRFPPYLPTDEPEQHRQRRFKVNKPPVSSLVVVKKNSPDADVWMWCFLPLSLRTMRRAGRVDLSHSTPPFIPSPSHPPARSLPLSAYHFSPSFDIVPFPFIPEERHTANASWGGIWYNKRLSKWFRGSLPEDAVKQWTAYSGSQRDPSGFWLWGPLSTFSESDELVDKHVCLCEWFEGSC